MKETPNETYTHSHAPVVVAAHARRTAEEAAWFLLPHLEDHMHLLDLGCGPGSITAGLGRHVTAVVGVDAAPAVLGEARRHADHQSVDNVDFVAATAYHLPFPDGRFDVVYAHQVLQHLADPVGALSEAARVLRPGGLLAVRDADYATMTHHPHDPLLDRWLDVYHQVARANGGEPDAGRRLLEWVQAAGFVDATATTTTWTYAEPAGREHWADLWAQRIIVDRFAEVAVANGFTTRDELTAIGDAFRAWARRPAGWFAFIHGEVLARRPA